MEAVAALGVASNVFQFVQFAWSLFDTASSVYQSASGSAVEAETLEEIYGTLSQFNLDLKLNDSCRPIPSSNHEAELLKLAVSCEKKCQQLLGLVRKLKVAPGEKRKAWESFRVALRTVCHDAEFRTLEKEIGGYQKSMALLLCAIISRNMQELRTGVAMSHILILDQLNKLQESLDKTGAIRGTKAESLDLVARLGELERLVNQLTELTLSSQLSQKEMKEEAVLASLDYEFRSKRQGAIHEAHRSTFEWIFMASPVGEGQRHRFLEWLEVGNGFFWISGKPGAGKSTLMKFIRHDDRTRTALKSWAESCKLVVGNHYFWSSGSKLQRSYEGLLRSILHEIFSQVPEIISHVCQNETWWSEPIAGTCNEWKVAPKWTVKSLTSCLQELAKTDSLPVAAKFCLFIDGLDEFEGDAEDHLEMCQALVELTASPRLKICFASRPWIVFRDLFGHDPSRTLGVHELTAGDIERFARDKLKDLPWNRYARDLVRNGSLLPPTHELEDDLVDSFAQKVRVRSQGVFLWVSLVVKLLKKGVTNRDSLKELEQRLASLPLDLEAFFWQIIHGVDACYHRKMAEFFRMALQGNADDMLIFDDFGIWDGRALVIMTYAMHDNEYDDPNKLSERLQCRWTEQVYREQLASIMQRLDAITGGLLEPDDSAEPGFLRRVRFLHRSVYDFLKTKAAAEFLDGKIGEDFDPPTAVFHSFVAMCQRLPPAVLVPSTDDRKFRIGPLVELFFAQFGAKTTDAVETGGARSERCLDDLERYLLEIASFCDGELDTATKSYGYMDNLLLGTFPRDVWPCEPVQAFAQVFRAVILCGGLASYVASKLQEDSKYFDGFPESPLKFASRILHHPFHKDRRMIPLCRVLLEHRFDPNETRAVAAFTSAGDPRREDTPWQTLLSKILTWPHKSSTVRSMVYAIRNGSISLFLSFGADLNTVVRARNYNYGKGLLPAWVSIFVAIFRNPDVDDDAYAELLRYLLVPRVDIRLLLMDYSYQMPGQSLISGWQELKSLLESLASGHHGWFCSKPPTSFLKWTSRFLYELAKMDKATGNMVLPWEEIRSTVQNVYPHHLVQPLLDIMTQDAALTNHVTDRE